MKPGYFASYSRVLSKTTGHTEERDDHEKPLARAGIENRNGRSVEVVAEQRAAERMTDRKNGNG